MSFDAHKNFAYSTVATAPSPATSGTSLVVASGDGAKFPATPFNATIWPSGVTPLGANAEIVRVTNISTDTFTITRTQESTSARAVIVGDQIAATITAKTITDIEAGAVGGDTLNVVSSSGSSQTINYSTADVWDITLTANCTFSLSGLTNGKPDYLTLVIRQDATGSRTVTWPTVTWIGTGIAPVLQTSPSAVDSVVLFSFDGGTTVFGIAQTSASGLRSGTSFPGSPSDGDLFYRTDSRILFEYNSSVTRWLSLDRKYVSIASSYGGISATGGQGRLPLFDDMYIESFVTTTNANPNDGSNFWTVALNKVDTTGTATTIGSFTTASDSTSYVRHSVSVAVVLAAASFPSLSVFVTTKTGAPGNLVYGAGVIVRSAG